MTSLGRSTKPAAATGAASAPRSPYEQIAALARAGRSKGRFLGDVLRAIAKHYASPYAAIHVRYPAEVVQDDCHAGPGDPNFWKSNVQQFLTESLGVGTARSKLLRAKSGNLQITFLSAPITDASGSPIGAVAMVVGPIEELQITRRAAEIESFTRLASHLVSFLDAPNSRAASTTSDDSTARAIAKAADFNTPEELAFGITNELRTKLSAELVAIGLVERRRVRVLSISGLDDVSKRSPGVVSLRAAMEECLDAGQVLVCQNEAGWTQEKLSSGHRLHKQWHASSKGDAVASIPLKVGGETVAIVSLRRRADQPFTPAILNDTRARVEPLAKGLLLTHRASRRLGRHARDVLGGFVDAVTTRGTWASRGAAAAAVLAALWFALGTIRYDLTVPCVLHPAQPLHLAAPFDGIISAVHAVAGDRVTVGDALVELDRTDAEQQRAELLAQLEVLERERDRATSMNQPAEAQIAQANQQLVKAKLDIVERTIQRSIVRAPITGVVVDGDLRKRLGGVTALGELLLTVAPEGMWTLELSVDEKLADEVALGQGGSFASFARPEQAHPFHVDRVLPTSRTREQKNVYAVEADLIAHGAWMRPGMEGVARVSVGARPVWWVALHRALDYLRINLWL